MRRDPSTRCALIGAGNVWFSGTPLGKFDPKTNEYYDSPEVKAAYDVKEGNGWQHLVHQNGYGPVWHGRPQDH